MCIRLLIKLNPRSVRSTFGALNVHIKLLINASDMSVAAACWRGIAEEYLVRKSWIVRIYVFPAFVVGNGPMMLLSRMLSPVCL